MLQELFEIESDFSPDNVRQQSGLRLLLSEPDALVLVAEADGRAIGMCTVQKIISTAQGGMSGLVEDMFVKKEYRRQGVGRSLLEAAEEWAGINRLSRLQLLAEADNAPALSFYSEGGWESTNLVCRRKFLD
jgi:GNAT superfamily N-acetyltransferase